VQDATSVAVKPGSRAGPSPQACAISIGGSTYRALVLGVPSIWLGVLSACFAVAPLTLAVSLGQAVERLGLRLGRDGGGRRGGVPGRAATELQIRPRPGADHALRSADLRP
jgi:hypothetical protein